MFFGNWLWIDRFDIHWQRAHHGAVEGQCPLRRVLTGGRWCFHVDDQRKLAAWRHSCVDIEDVRHGLHLGAAYVFEIHETDLPRFGADVLHLPHGVIIPIYAVFCAGCR